MDAATLIRTARRRSGLSQRELARRSSTTAAAICLYESGTRIPRVDTLARVIAATGSTLILDRADAPPTIDLEANGRDLEELLELAEQLPRRSARRIEAPVFAALAG